MLKIEQGIAANERHIFNIEHNIAEETSFSDQIVSLGFRDLDDFFENKREYDMQHVLRGNVYSVPPSAAMTTLRGLIESGKYGIVSVYTNETCVHHGNDQSKQLNSEYCDMNNIPIYKYDSFGGSIVATEGDYSFAVLLPQDVDVSAEFLLNGITKIISKHFRNVTSSGNDILINGAKVAGTTCFGTDGYVFFIAHISMSDKTELIKNICGEPVSNKVPWFIDTSVLTTNELIEELLSWLQGL